MCKFLLGKLSVIVTAAFLMLSFGTAHSEDLAILAPETLKSYIDAGYKTPKGAPVVIINVDGKVPEKVIKGALPMPQNDYFTDSRSDGPMVVVNMVATGATMDKAISKAGITKDSLVVITGSNLTNNNIHRVWWTFSYWGFSNENVKILDGADSYFSATYPDYMEAPKPISVKPTQFSVKGLTANNIDGVRATLGEIFDSAVAGDYKADGTGKAVLIATMPPAIPVMKDGKEVMKVGNKGTVTGIVHGSTQIDTKNNTPRQYLKEDGRYKSAEEIAAVITAYPTGKTFLPADKNVRIITHCIRGQSTVPHFFVIKEILGYKNVAVYDGSWYEWGNMANWLANEDAPFAVGFATTYLLWDGKARSFIDQTTGKAVNAPAIKKSPDYSNTKFDTAKYTDYLMLNTDVAGEFTYNNAYVGNGREVNKADKAYKAK